MVAEQTFVIVGASLAGAKAAETLREADFGGRIVLVGDETERPYERPPLSKEYLADKAEKAKIYVHGESWYGEHGVELRLGTRVTAIDRSAREVVLGDGERVRYDKLLLTTGSSPRSLGLPGADLDGVLYLRGVEDSERIRAAISDGGPLVVVGAGWIGLETAAAARGYGTPVTVVEPRPTPLHGALGPELGQVFADLHRANGVDLRTGSEVAEIRGGEGRVRAVVTRKGDELPARTVVVGIGAQPNAGLAEAAGIQVDNGILTDASLRTSDPDVFAAGDVANSYNPLLGRRIRVEHWANALHGGPAAARAMLGQDVVYDQVPYFFTDQYDLGMEYSGHTGPGAYDRVVYRGDVGAREFIAFWLTGGRVVAGMNVNIWDVTTPVQDLIRSGKKVDAEKLADPAVPFEEL